MKISIITITCRENPRLVAMGSTIAGSLGARTDLDLEWIIVDDKHREVPEELMRVRDDRIVIWTLAPLPTEHRSAEDKAPAHNSARSAGLFAATGEYVVFLNDCTLVTRGWVDLVADAAKLGLGFRCKTIAMNDLAIPDDGRVIYRDHNDRLHHVPPATVAGACWGAPREAFMKINGFDLAYDGEDKGHDADAIHRLARIGVKFVTSERAYAIRLKRTKTKQEVSTRKDVFIGARNQRLLNQLRRDATRIHPMVEAHPRDGGLLDVPATAVVGAATTGEPASDPSPVPGNARDTNHAAAVTPELIDQDATDDLLDHLD